MSGIIGSRILVNLSLAALLAGCGTTQSTSPLAMEVGASAACVGEVEGRPAFAPLRAKSPPLGEMSPANLGDTAKPTPEEQELARGYLSAIAACTPRTEAILNPRDQAAGRAILTTWHEQEQLYAALASGRLTWGQFNRMTEALGRRMDRQLRTAMVAASTTP
ncbi:hypothetical protein [Skermanella pratensis]|uniref:hypothetical protein n=1 Tax=Skermanella pratensis TaxID=2233999 RepID=UPI00130132F9|nr:hypothetical protein [Skermanella pratensis]